MKRIGSLIIILALFLAACSKNQQEQTGQVSAKKAYSVSPEEVEFKWIAYKTSDKIAVPGTFEKINITLGTSEGSLSEILQSVSFEIDGTSINSNDPERDAKLRTFFVGNWTDSLITGKIKETSLQKNAGKGTFLLKWNGLKKDLDFTFNLKNDTLFLFSSIQMPEWNAGEAAKALNTECKEVHTGKDGKSVLWDEVSLEISVPLHPSTTQEVQESAEAIEKAIGK